MERIKVKVKSAAKNTYWYADKIGKTYFVYANIKDEERMLTGMGYILCQDVDRNPDGVWHQIAKDDCELLN